MCQFDICTWVWGGGYPKQRTPPPLMGYQGPVQPSEHFVFCLQQQTVCALNDHCSANGHVSLINSNSSVIAQSLGDIEYFCVMKKTLWAPTSLFATANTPICRLLPFSERSLRTVVQ